MAARNDAMETMKRRWLRKTGEPMPEEIQRLPFDRIIRAVTLVEQGNTVFVPPESPVVVTGKSGGSFLDWDGAQNG